MAHRPSNSTAAVAPSEFLSCTLLRLPQVLKLFPVARTTWWRGIKDGRFPRPVRLGPRSVAWRASDITALIERLGHGEAA